MDEVLASGRDQRAIDKQHLGTLSVLHFVGAGLALLGIVFVFLHYALFSTMFNNPDLWKGTPNPPPPGLFDAFRWLYVAVGGWYATSLLLNFLAGLFLRAQKHRTFCFVVGAFNCLHIPLGTILGIFTIIVLARDSVRVVFDAMKNGPDRFQ
jgi:hypothetical protein